MGQRNQELYDPQRELQREVRASMRGEDSLKGEQSSSLLQPPTLVPPASQRDLVNSGPASAKVPHSLYLNEKTLQKSQWEQNNLVLADGVSHVDRV